MILRPIHTAAVRGLLENAPVVALLWARQVGKTTLARQIAEGAEGVDAHWFDLEDPEDRARLQEPKLTLAPFADSWSQHGYFTRLRSEGS